MSKAVSTLYGGIAQLGECLTGSQKVMGSSPIISTTLVFVPVYYNQYNKTVIIMTRISLEKNYNLMI